MNKGDCGVCSYWQKTIDRSEDKMQDEGICRRHAPVGIPVNDEDYSEEGWLAKWPRTCAESDWCGDFVVRADLNGRERVQSSSVLANGCICPSGAELTCQGFGCPRKVFKLGPAVS